MRWPRAMVRRVVLPAALAAVSLAACSDDDVAVPQTVLESFATLPLPTGAEATGAPTTTDPALAPGVAGLEDGDPFCAAWARYSGTLQVIGVAASFGGLPSDRVAVLEMFAAPVLAAAVDAIDAAWPTEPAEVVAERADVVDRFVGPFGRRADAAVDVLRAAGATDAQLAALGEAWMGVLTTRDPLNPTITPPAVDATLSDLTVAAGERFDESRTPFTEDPSLRVGSVAIPATNAYLATACPDLASNGVGDSV